MKKVTVTLALLIMAMASFSLFGNVGTVAAAKDSESIVVTTPLKVTSSVQSATAQTYITTVTGKIKNTTNGTLENIEITLNVKTSFLGITGTFVLTIPSISAGQVYTVNHDTYTTENFETVVSLSAKINGGLSFALSNSVAAQPATNTPTQKPTDSEKPVNLGLWAGIIIAAAVAITVLVLVIKYKNEQREEDLREEARARKAAQYQPVVNVTVAPPAPNVNVSVNTPPAQPTAPPTAIGYCPFCGFKGAVQSNKCPNCSGNLDF